MQINIAVPDSGTYVTLADSLNTLSGRTNPDLIDYKPPTLKTLEQIEPLAGSATQFVANRGNATVNLIVPIRSFVATATAARQFWAALFAQLNAGLVDLQVLDASSADATYMPACSIGDVTPDQNDGERGVALFYTLKFTGNNFTTTAP